MDRKDDTSRKEYVYLHHGVKSDHALSSHICFGLNLSISGMPEGFAELADHNFLQF